MRTNLALDDGLVAKAQAIRGLTEKCNLVPSRDEDKLGFDIGAQ
jgi:Arc/MetJ family transcription regulator